MDIKSKREKMERESERLPAVRKPRNLQVSVDNMDTARLTHAVPDFWQTDSNIQAIQTYSEWYFADWIKTPLDTYWAINIINTNVHVQISLNNTHNFLLKISSNSYSAELCRVECVK